MAESAHQTTSVVGNYNTLREDPQSLIQMVNKYVKIKLIKNMFFQGYVHSIDPITYSVILSIPREGTFQTTLIPGHAIIDITEEPTNTEAPLLTISSPCENKEKILQRKAKLTAWFKKNLLQVKEDGERIVVGAAKVLPPYNVMDIFAENPIVAIRIRRLIEIMPDHFEA